MSWDKERIAPRKPPIRERKVPPPRRLEGRGKQGEGVLGFFLMGAGDTLKKGGREPGGRGGGIYIRGGKGVCVVGLLKKGKKDGREREKIGVSKQAVFKKIKREPLSTSLQG